jgi:hypothetical protein
MDKMELVAFFRMAIAIVLALFCVGLILAINVIFFGNAFYILKNSFQKKKNIVGAKEELSRIKSINNEEARNLKQTMPKAS